MFLGIDLGTSNVKALVVDGAGRVAAQGSAAVERYCGRDGAVEQDLEQIWTATAAAVRQATRQSRRRIRAIGISSQGGALQLLDNQDKPIGRVISWMDQRGAAFDRALTRRLGQPYLQEHIGFGQSAITIGQVLRLQKEQPRQWARCRKIGFVGDCIVGRLCGRRAHDPTSLSLAMLLNPKLGQADPAMLRRLGLKAEQLPDLIPATEAAGTLLPQAARQLGLPAGIPVSAAVHDQYTTVLGAASVRKGDVTLGTGTAWVLVVNTVESTASLRPVCPRVFLCPHPVQGLFGQLLSLTNGGSALEWVLRLTGREKMRGPQLDALIQSVPAGSDGLCFWPLLATDTSPQITDNPNGWLTGLTLGHTAAHLARAVIEGLAYELQRYVQTFRDAGHPVRRLMMCGDAAASAVTPQIVADVTGVPVVCAGRPAISAFGAAILARAISQPGADLAKLAQEWKPKGKTVRPGREAKVYRGVFERYMRRFEET